MDNKSNLRVEEEFNKKYAVGKTGLYDEEAKDTSIKFESQNFPIWIPPGLVDTVSIRNCFLYFKVSVSLGILNILNLIYR